MSPVFGSEGIIGGIIGDTILISPLRFATIGRENQVMGIVSPYFKRDDERAASQLSMPPAVTALTETMSDSPFLS
jgi:hypothetical protein